MNEIDTILKQIGQDFRNRRRAKGLSVKQLNELAGCKGGAKYIWKIESGKNYRLATLIKYLLVIDFNKYSGTNFVYKGVSEYDRKRKCERIKRIIAQELRLNPEQVEGKSKDTPLVRARYYGYKMMRDLTKLPLREIGSQYHRKHPAVVAGLKELANWKDTEDELYEDYDRIFEKVKLGLSKT